MTQEMIEAATEYLRLGFPLFILSPGSKKPLRESRGFYDASSDLEHLTELILANPECNLATATGNGVFVVDVDVKRLDEPGDLSITRLVDTFGELPATRIHETPSGGKHLFFKSPPKTVIRSRAGSLATRNDSYPGIDIRGENGYVVLPPSRTPVGEYLVLDEDLETPIADAPKWLIKLVSSRMEVAANGGATLYNGELEILPDEEYDIIEKALEHLSSDDRETWIAYGIALRRLDNQDRAFLIWDAWSAKSDKYDDQQNRKDWHTIHSMRTGSREDHAQISYRTILHDAQSSGWHNPGAAPTEASPFISNIPQPGDIVNVRRTIPAHIIDDAGGFLYECMAWINDTVRYPCPEISLGAVLSLIAVLHQGYTVDDGLHLKTQILITGRTSSGKTSVLELLRSLLKAAGREDIIGKSVYTSAAALTDDLRSRGGAMLWSLDEFARRYDEWSGPKASERHAALKTTMMELADNLDEYRGQGYAKTPGEDQNEDRGRIENPHLCLLGSTVPDSLKRVFDGSSALDGSLNRLVIIAGDRPKVRGPRSGDKHNPPKALIEWVKAAGSSRTTVIAENTSAGVELDLHPKPDPIRLTPEAKADWFQCEDDYMLIENGCGTVSPLVGRSPEHVLRLAALRALSRDPRVPQVTPTDIWWGGEIAASSIRSQLEVLQGSRENGRTDDMRRIVRAVIKAPSATEKGVSECVLEGLSKYQASYAVPIESWKSLSDVTRAVRHMEKRLRMDLIADLVTLGDLDTLVIPSKTRKSSFFRSTLPPDNASR